MLQDCATFSGYSVRDITVAKQFYEEKLGLNVEANEMGLQLKLKNQNVFIYAKPDHQPASFTVLNFVVDDIDKKMDELLASGVTFEKYDDLGGGAVPDEKGILRGLAAGMGPDIAWFKDPDGNVLSILQES
jgi:catechol 2,3-dioxygenase-like lactoylglutathione lyase family enzyme